jgi:hypothetical protein
MPTDPLENLLRQTDAAHPPGIASHHDLATGARVAWRRTRRRRRIAQSLAVAVIGAVGISALMSHRPTRQVASVIQPAMAQLSSIIDRKDIEAQQANEERLIQTMLAVEHHNEAERELSRFTKVNVLQRLDDEREQFALTVLKYVTTAPESSDEAAIYRQVAEYFPGTGAATVARQQLQQMKKG